MFFWTLILSLLLFIVLIEIPVLTTPGNDFLFQIHILPPLMLALLIIISILNGLLFTMQIYIHKRVTERKKAGLAAGAGSTLLSVISATVACSACYSAVVAAFGLGAVTFVGTYRIPITLFALAVSVFAITQAAKRINNNCEVCEI
jgi:uncharacterized integral membrane protein